MDYPAAYTKNARIKVMVVALPLTAWGLSRALEEPEAGALQCVAVAPSIGHAVPLFTSCKPDLLLVDLDSEAGPDSLTELSAGGPKKILALTSSADPQAHDRAILAGARGVLDKREEVSTLVKALKKINDGEMWMDRSATSRIFLELSRQQAARRPTTESARLSTVTQRERQAIEALMSNPAAPAKVLAQGLSISEHTLRNHLTSIYAKLGVANRTELYAFVQRHRPSQLNL